MNYYNLIKYAVDYGDVVPSRYGGTLETLNARVDFRPGAFYRRPGISWNLGFAELLLLVAGGFDLDVIAAVAPKADLSLFSGSAAYGPRVSSQIPRVIDALQRDSTTRQASLILPRWSDAGTGDNPCTQIIQFLQRKGCLYTTVYLRSWDLIKGLPYDAVMYGGLSLIVADLLGVPAANCTVFAGSAHVYASDARRCPRPDDMPRFFSVPGPPRVPGGPPVTWTDWVEWAHSELDVAPWAGLPGGIEWERRDDTHPVSEGTA